MNILFICTGNVCRSVMAKHLFARAAKAKKLKSKTDSAGIGAFPGSPPPEEMIALMKGEGVDISKHRSAPLTPPMLQGADLALTMTKKQRDAIVKKVPPLAKKIVVLKEHVGLKGDIADPIGGSAKVYEKVLAEVKEAVEKLVEQLK